MDATEANKQITQMISFILAEATDRANDIQKKGEEEFSIEVHRIITEQKEKVRSGYEKKSKQIETSYAIAKSMAINKQRLEKIKARQEVLTKLSDEVRGKLSQEVKGDQYKAYLSKLIVQGLLMLLEENVRIRCRETDKAVVQSVLASASSEYCKVIKDETGAEKKCALTIDETQFLSGSAVAGKDGPSCLGGVVLATSDGKITIDNTIDLRLRLVIEQDKPAIRKLLFGGQ